MKHNRPHFVFKSCILLGLFVNSCNLLIQNQTKNQHLLKNEKEPIYYGDTAKFDTNKEYKRGLFVYQGDTLPYREFNLSSIWEEPLPLVIFLHGSGEKGNDNSSQLSHGSEWIWRASYSGFPCHAIFPQCSKNSYWSNVSRTTDSSGKPHFTFNDDIESTKAMTLLMAFVNHLKKQSYIDTTRIYIGGLSMGGMGTIEIMKRMPKTFAAAFPICGGGKITNLKELKHSHWWFFHGLKDDIVPPICSIEIANQLKNAGINTKITLFPNANHNSWDSAFAEPELLPWMFQQKLK